jgi:hypothetical protein
MAADNAPWAGGSENPQPGGGSDSLTAPALPPDLAKLKRYFTEARQLTEVARTKSLQAIDYYDTDQLTPYEIEALRKRRQPTIAINRISPAIGG